METLCPSVESSGEVARDELTHLSQFLTLNLHKWLILRTHDRAKGLRLSPQKRFWSRFNTRRCTVRFLSIRIVSLNQ